MTIGLRRIAIITVSLLSITTANADWVADPDDKRQAAAAAAIDNIKERVPKSLPYFEDAYGYAILPAITRIGLGFGGAYGKGVVIEGDRLIGTTGYWQFTSGIQAGAKYFSMVILFKDKAALDTYTAEKAQFMGQAGLAIGNQSLDGTPAYNDGVAVFMVTREQAERLSEGAVVQVQMSLSGVKADGEIEFISPTTDAESGLVRLKVRVDNQDQKLHSGEACTLLR